MLDESHIISLAISCSEIFSDFSLKLVPSDKADLTDCCLIEFDAGTGDSVTRLALM